MKKKSGWWLKSALHFFYACSPDSMNRLIIILFWLPEHTHICKFWVSDWVWGYGVCIVLLYYSVKHEVWNTFHIISTATGWHMNLLCVESIPCLYCILSWDNRSAWSLNLFARLRDLPCSHCMYYNSNCSVISHRSIPITCGSRLISFESFPHAYWNGSIYIYIYIFFHFFSLPEIFSLSQKYCHLQWHIWSRMK